MHKTHYGVYTSSHISLGNVIWIGMVDQFAWESHVFDWDAAVQELRAEVLRTQRVQRQTTTLRQMAINAGDFSFEPAATEWRMSPLTSTRYQRTREQRQRSTILCKYDVTPTNCCTRIGGRAYEPRYGCRVFRHGLRRAVPGTNG